MNGWQLIETAPPDEDLLLGWWRTWPERKWATAIDMAQCTKGGWQHGRATHWMRQPAPPEEPGAT